MDENHSDICIVGAGMAGLACASALARAGREVRVLDKGRGPGGRMAARRAEIAGQSVSFDHGAQYFTARDPAFRAQVEQWESEGHVARWKAASPSQEDPAFIGTPGMNAPIRAMSEGLRVHWSTRAQRLWRDGATWRIEAEDASLRANRVFVAIPAEQAAILLDEAAPDLAAIAAQVTSQPCWAVMAAFAERLDIAGDTVRSADAPIAWAARNSAKPGRTGSECWVIHASPARSRALLEHGKDEAARALLEDFANQTGVRLTEPVHLAAHRWLYAMPQSLAGESARFDPHAGIGIAGDYLHSPRVEGAWLSGEALAHRVLAAARR